MNIFPNLFRDQIAPKVLAAAALGLWLAGCGQSPPKPPQPGVLATFTEGEITLTELDHHILSLPMQRRTPPPDRKVDQWLERELEKIFQKRILLNEENLNYLKSEAGFERNLQLTQDQSLASAYLKSVLPREGVSDDEVRAVFEANRAKLAIPEKRTLLNFLLAFGEGATEAEKAQIRQKCEAFRQEIVQGASFERLAREHSQSTTAANGGMVGAVTRDQLRGEIADFVFGLTPGQVSQVLENRAGCQLFLVRDFQPGFEPSFTEMAPQLRNHLAAEKSQAWALANLNELLTAQGVELPQWPEQGLPEGVTPDTEFFALGDRKLAVRDILMRPEKSGSPRDAMVKQVGFLVFSQRFRELHPDQAARLARNIEEDMTFEYSRRQSLLAVARQMPEAELEAFYTSHQNLFTKEPEIEIAAFYWPIGAGDPLTYMEAPQRFARELRETGQAGEAWSEIPRETVPLMNLRTLAMRRPDLGTKIPQEVSQGMVIGPYRFGQRLCVLRIESFLPTRPLSFLEAREKVILEFTNAEQARIEEKWLEDLKKEHNFIVYHQALESFGRSLAGHLQEGEKSN